MDGFQAVNVATESSNRKRPASSLGPDDVHPQSGSLWALEEDAILHDYGPTSNWTAASAKLPHRSRDACRSRWKKISLDSALNHLESGSGSGSGSAMDSTPAAQPDDPDRPLTRGSPLSTPDPRSESRHPSRVVATTSQPTPELRQLLRLLRDHRQKKELQQRQEEELQRQSDVVQQQLDSQARQQEELGEAQRALLELETKRRKAQERVNQLREEQRTTQQSLEQSQQLVGHIKNEVLSGILAVRAAEQQLDAFESKYRSMIEDDIVTDDRPN